MADVQAEVAGVDEDEVGEQWLQMFENSKHGSQKSLGCHLEKMRSLLAYLQHSGGVLPPRRPTNKEPPTFAADANEENAISLCNWCETVRMITLQAALAVTLW